MKCVFLIVCICLYALTATAQKNNTLIKERICRQKHFSGRDSVIFCKVFDSFNREFSVGRIIIIQRDKPMFIPFFGNIMILNDTSFLLMRWVEELAHAVQFSQQGNKYKLKMCTQVCGVIWRCLFKNKKKHYNLSDMYDDLYYDKKSFEYEAHSVIESQIYTYLEYCLNNTPL